MSIEVTSTDEVLEVASCTVPDFDDSSETKERSLGLGFETVWHWPWPRRLLALALTLASTLLLKTP